jgi:hypothetical protein
VPAAEDSYNEDDEDSCGSTVGVGGATGPTPPDSPQIGREKAQAARSISQQYPYQYTGKIIPELDIYAIPCKEGKYKIPIEVIIIIWGLATENSGIAHLSTPFATLKPKTKLIFSHASLFLLIVNVKNG